VIGLTNASSPCGFHSSPSVSVRNGTADRGGESVTRALRSQGLWLTLTYLFLLLLLTRPYI
jgi:hypothetical protein